MKSIFLNLLIFMSVQVLAQAPVVIRQDNQKKTGKSPYERFTTYSAGVRYGVYLPQSGMKTYISDPGRGLSLTFDWVYANNFAMGIEAGYASFNQRLPRAIYRNPNDGTDISAVQTRTMSQVPLLFTGTYFLTNAQSNIRPYVQAGVGFTLVDYVNYWGTFDDADAGFKFTGRASAGVKAIVGKLGDFGHWGLDARASYQATGFEYDFISNAHTLGVTVGVFYRWW
jgi:hypothetical protein